MNRSVLSAILFMFWLASLARAQGLATVVGSVTDPSGKSVPAAQVTLTLAGTAITRGAFTNTEGQYAMPSLPPARYSLAVVAAGFRKYVREDITLQADQTATLNVRLQLGQTTETITVTADAQQVDTQTATLKQVVEERRMGDLPLNGRYAAELTLLVAGAVRAPSSGVDQGAAKTLPGAVVISTNGSRQNQVSFNLDGGNHIDEYTNVNSPFPFPDALQEFSVQTSNYGAQYGQNAGGVVNVVTKSGTNSFHGDAFGFVRNKVFNARNFFADRRDDLKRTQFGATAGGPVLVPRLYNGRDRTFFFAGYQGTLVRNITRGMGVFVPTDANRAGDFSDLLNAANPDNPVGKVTRINDPLSGRPFPDNLIPASRFDPAAPKFLQFIPRAGGNGRLQYALPVRDDYNEFLVRIDQYLAGKNRLSARYFLTDVVNATPFDGKSLLTLDGVAGQRAQDAMISETHIFNPTLLNDLRFNYARTKSSRDQPVTVPTVTDFGVAIWQPPTRALQSIAVSGFFSAGTGAPAIFVRNRFNWVDDLKWMRGRHSFAFGGSFERSRVDLDNFFNAPGVFTFTNDYTNYSIASLMLGKLRTFRQATGSYRNVRNHFVGLYASDTWRVSRRFTLDLGVRWDPFFPWDEIKGRIVLFRADAFERGEKSRVFVNAPPGLFYPGFGDPGPKQGTTSDLNNVAPRLGFAYDLTGDGRTSIRGGAGFFYDARSNSNQNGQISQVNPLVAQITVTDPDGPFSNPYLGIKNPFPAPFPPPADAPFPPPVLVSTFTPGQKYITPILYNWNLAVERQLLPDWLLRVAYAASHSSHLTSNLNLNNAVYVPGSKLGTDQRRRYQGFSNIFQGSQEGNASYNALQLGMEKRFMGGPRILQRITILANYTYSKSIDNIPIGQNIVSVGGGSVAQALPFDHPGRQRFDRGPSEFDHTHRLVTSYVWELPALPQSSRPLRAVLGGWKVTGVVQAQSGDALTLLAGRDQSKTGLGQDRAELRGGPARGAGGCGASEAPCVGYFNSAAFAVPAEGAFGDLGKGAMRGPGMWNCDMGFLKAFVAQERFRVQLRFEFFNIFNRANFNNPTTSVSSGGFGGIRGAADPRIGQVALKVLF